MGLDATGRHAPLAAVDAVRSLGDTVGARRTLGVLGVRPDQVPAIAAGALADPVSVNHPRRFARDEVERVLYDHL
jgi:alcohol dehydrogenase class IV